MAIYGLSQRTTATVVNNTSWEIRSSASAKTRILEMGISQTTAVAGVYGIGRPGAIGVTPTTPQTFVDEGDGNAPAAQTTAAVAWGTAPTSPTFFNRRLFCSNIIGQGAIFSFPRGFIIPVSNSVTVWIIATAPVCDVYAVVDE